MFKKIPFYTCQFLGYTKNSFNAEQKIQDIASFCISQCVLNKIRVFIKPYMYNCLSPSLSFATPPRAPPFTFYLDNKQKITYPRNRNNCASTFIFDINLKRILLLGVFR